MIYFATYYAEDGFPYGVPISIDASDDREAVAKALCSDPIYDESVAGWTLVDSFGCEVKPLPSDYT